MVHVVRLGTVIVCCCLAGCGSGQSKNLTPPVLDPVAAAEQAIAEYDTDQDGSIGGREFSKCLGLKAALSTTDGNGDGALTRDEIAARLQAYVDSQSAIQYFELVVTVNRQPVEGLSVTLVPESFLTPAIEPASGTTTRFGRVTPAIDFEDPEIAKQNIVGVRPGMYRVEVSQTDAQGKEAIQSRFNTDSILGVEVGLDFHADTPELNVSYGR